MLAVVVTVAPFEAEVASEWLWALGVVAIEERTAIPNGHVELWTSLGDDSGAITLALAALPFRWRLEVVDPTIADTWRRFAVPTWVAPDLVVHPAWNVPDVDASVIAISIEPGSTFGLGDHPTTVLTLRAMRKVLTRGGTVLDVGCGSGVLAIAACRLGASRADAVDISPAATSTTRDNAERNGVVDRVRASMTPLAEVVGSFDVVVANILAPTLIELAADLKRVTARAGALVISGVLAARHDHVLESLRPLRQVDRTDQDGWTAITLRG